MISIIINLIIINYLIKDLDDNGSHLIHYMMMLYVVEEAVNRQLLVQKQQKKVLLMH